MRKWKGVERSGWGGKWSEGDGGVGERGHGREEMREVTRKG